MTEVEESKGVLIYSFVIKEEANGNLGREWMVSQLWAQ